MIKTEGLEATVSACTPCNVVSLSRTSVTFNTPPLKVTATMEGPTNCRFWDFITMTFIHQLMFNKTGSARKSSSLPTDFCLTNPVRQSGQLILVQSIHSVNCLCTKHSQILRYVRVRVVRHHAVVGCTDSFSQNILTKLIREINFEWRLDPKCPCHGEQSEFASAWCFVSDSSPNCDDRV